MNIPEIKKITILGSGNVATHLAGAFYSSNVEIVQIFSPNTQHAKELAEKVKCPYTSEIKKISDNTDLYLFSISDSAILPILKQGTWNNKICVHTAGSVHIDIFKSYTTSYGVIYPFQTFSKNIPIDIKEVPFFIEGSNEDIKNLLTQLVKKISPHIQHINSEQRKWLHLSGVFACNFVNHMLAISEQILNQNNIPRSNLHPLVKETIKKALKYGPIRSQTGPALRNNIDILTKHIQMLEKKPEWQKIYTFVSESIYKTHNQ